MIVLTHYTAATYRAQIRSSAASGFRQLYTGSCTMGEEAAAQAIVRKCYGEAAVATIRQIKDPAEIKQLTGDWTTRTKPSQAYRFWEFRH
jgi:hypothetical protein